MTAPIEWSPQMLARLNTDLAGQVEPDPSDLPTELTDAETLLVAIEDASHRLRVLLSDGYIQHDDGLELPTVWRDRFDAIVADIQDALDLWGN